MVGSVGDRVPLLPWTALGSKDRAGTPPGPGKQVVVVVGVCVWGGVRLGACCADNLCADDIHLLAGLRA